MATGDNGVVERTTKDIKDTSNVAKTRNDEYTQKNGTNSQTAYVLTEANVRGIIFLEQMILGYQLDAKAAFLCTYGAAIFIHENKKVMVNPTISANGTLRYQSTNKLGFIGELLYILRSIWDDGQERILEKDVPTLVERAIHKGLLGFNINAQTSLFSNERGPATLNFLISTLAVEDTDNDKGLGNKGRNQPKSILKGRADQLQIINGPPKMSGTEEKKKITWERNNNAERLEKILNAKNANDITTALNPREAKVLSKFWPSMHNVSTLLMGVRNENNGGNLDTIHAILNDIMQMSRCIENKVPQINELECPRNLRRLDLNDIEKYRKDAMKWKEALLYRTRIEVMRNHLEEGTEDSHLNIKIAEPTVTNEIANFLENQLMGRDVTEKEAEFIVRKYENYNSIIQDDTVSQRLNIIKKVPVKALIRALQDHKATLFIRADTEGMSKTALALKYIVKTLPEFKRISGIISQKEGQNIVIGRPERSVRLQSKITFMSMEIVENDDTLILSTPDEAFEELTKEKEELVLKWSRESSNPHEETTAWANKLASFVNRNKGTLRELPAKQTPNKKGENSSKKPARAQYRSNSEGRRGRGNTNQTRTWSSERKPPGNAPRNNLNNSYRRDNSKNPTESRGSSASRTSEQRIEDEYVPRGGRRPGGRRPRRGRNLYRNSRGAGNNEENRGFRRGTGQQRRGRGRRRRGNSSESPQRSGRSRSPFDGGRGRGGPPRRRGRRRG